MKNYSELAIILLESGKFTYDMGRELISDFQSLASKDDQCPEDEVAKLDHIMDHIELYICAVEDIGEAMFPEAV